MGSSIKDGGSYTGTGDRDRITGNKWHYSSEGIGLHSVGGIGIYGAISGGNGELAMGLEAVGHHDWASQGASGHILKPQDSNSNASRMGLGIWMEAPTSCCTCAWATWASGH